MLQNSSVRLLFTRPEIVLLAAVIPCRIVHQDITCPPPLFHVMLLYSNGKKARLAFHLMSCPGRSIIPTLEYSFCPCALARQSTLSLPSTSFALNEQRPRSSSCPGHFFLLVSALSPRCTTCQSAIHLYTCQPSIQSSKCNPLPQSKHTHTHTHHCTFDSCFSQGKCDRALHKHASTLNTRRRRRRRRPVRWSRTSAHHPMMRIGIHQYTPLPDRLPFAPLSRQARGVNQTRFGARLCSPAPSGRQTGRQASSVSRLRLIWFHTYAPCPHHLAQIGARQQHDRVYRVYRVARVGSTGTALLARRPMGSVTLTRPWSCRGRRQAQQQ